MGWREKFHLIFDPVVNETFRDEERGAFIDRFTRPWSHQETIEVMTPIDVFNFSNSMVSYAIDKHQRPVLRTVKGVHHERLYGGYGTEGVTMSHDDAVNLLVHEGFLSQEEIV